MKEIGFSAMIHSPQTSEVLRNLLDQFEARHNVHVNLQLFDWSEAHPELSRMGIYQLGPDVSEVATTWLSDLTAMNALRPFSPADIEAIGGAKAFVPCSWQAGQVAKDSTRWSVPWLAETYVIHYRRDLLRQAGIDEHSAFQTHAQIDQTVARLAESGAPVAVELPLECDHYGTLHVLASWVWGWGGDFCTPDGKHATFDQAEALAAMQAYFGLLRHLSPPALQKLAQRGVDDLFRKGESAIAFGTLHLTLPREYTPPQALENWAVAALPSPCFAGGSGLVVWKHAQHEQTALELVRFLNSAPTLDYCARPMVALPARLESLEAPQVLADPLMKVMAEALKNGRTYPPVKLWGTIEDKLVNALLLIGAEVLANPGLDLNETICRFTLPLSRRLNITLEQLSS